MKNEANSVLVMTRAQAKQAKKSKTKVTLIQKVQPLTKRGRNPGNCGRRAKKVTQRT